MHEETEPRVSKVKQPAQDHAAGGAEIWLEMPGPEFREDTGRHFPVILGLLRSWNPEAIMACFPDDEQRKCGFIDCMFYFLFSS